MKTLSQYDWGKTIRVTLKRIDTEEIFNPSGADSIKIVFVKPDGTVTPKTMDLYTDGSDGKVTYVIEDGLLDQAGIWTFQVVVIDDGYEMYSDHGEFNVRISFKAY